MSRLELRRKASDPQASARIGGWSRGIRLTACALTLLGLLAGTVLGSDDDFPLGPFHMYSSRVDPNSDSRELRVLIVLASGATVDVTNEPGAPRRAEIEGRVGQLQNDPSELRKLVPFYTAHVSGTPAKLELVWRNHPLHDGKTASSYDTLICSIPATP